MCQAAYSIVMVVTIDIRRKNTFYVLQGMFFLSKFTMDKEIK